jgi:proteasome alpha subunit
MPLYASPEQLMRERSELARKGIARGRSAIAMAYADGVLLVAENPSTTLHKLSEIYDRIGFAAAGRYGEYENLRRAGIRHVDLWGYAYDRRDVSARQLANVYAQTLGSIFSEQIKPYEVEICVAQVGAAFGEDELYRLTYDGSINHEPHYVVMGGQSDTITSTLKESYSDEMTLEDALATAVHALQSSSTSSANGTAKKGEPTESQTSAEGLREKLEVAVLERARPHRAFRRITGAALTALLPEPTTPESTTETGSGDTTA